MTSFPPKTSPLEQAIGPTRSLVLKILATSTALALEALLLLDLATNIADGPCQHRYHEDCHDPPWLLRMVAQGSIYKDDVPSEVVEVVGEVGKREGAIGEEEVLDRAEVPTGARLFLAVGCKAGAAVDDASTESGGIDLESHVAGVLLLEVGGTDVTVVDEDGVATVVDGELEGGLEAKAEDEEAVGRAAVEDGSGGMEFGASHAAGGGGGGGIE